SGLGTYRIIPKRLKRKRAYSNAYSQESRNNPFWNRNSPQVSNPTTNPNQNPSTDHSQCLVGTGNMIVLWTRYKGFDSLNLRKAKFHFGKRWERQGEQKLR